MRVLKVVCGAAVLTMIVASGARADEWNKKTILTFSGPVQIPGVTLPAGTYVFKLADLAGNRHVVQVFDRDEKKIFKTLMAVPNQRLDASDKPVILFSERPSGSAQAVKVWFYPGDRIGNEFIYPRKQAIEIAKSTHQRVRAMNDDTSAVTTEANSTTAMKTADVGYFDEDGNWRNDDPVTTIATVPEPTTPAPSSTMARADNSTGTSDARATRTHLPRTASNMTLFELLGGLALAGGLVIRRYRIRYVAAQ
jgi:hypothetical protein